MLNNLDSGSGSLRDAVKHANNGDTIAFAPRLAGQTITLTSGQLTINKDLDIEGPNASLLAISGNDAERIFNIHKGLTVTIANLTITHGRATGSNSTQAGGGVLNDSSTLTLANDVFSYNEVHGSNISGGAIVNLGSGSLTITNTAFIANKAIGDPDGGEVGGAALATFTFGEPSGSVTIDSSAFTDNVTLAGDGGVSNGSSASIGVADGGAIHADGFLSITNSVFTGNRALAGNGGVASNAKSAFVDFAIGGAIFSHEGGLVLSGDTFRYNQAVGGSNATCVSSFGFVGTAFGGALNNIEAATVTSCTFDHNEALGGSADLGSNTVMVGMGLGGGINNGAPGFAAALTASNLTLTNNRAVGGAGNTGAPLTGDGIGGALLNAFGATATVSNGTFCDNQAIGGAGGSGANGGNGFGGGIYNDGSSTLEITRTRVIGNSARGGAAGIDGDPGQGVGGGAYFALGGIVCLDGGTRVAGNLASTSDDNVFGNFTMC